MTTIKKDSAKNPHPQKKLSFFQKVLLTIGLLLLVLTALPAVVITLIGLLPSITVMLTDPKNTAKLTVVGGFNLAGVFICLMNIFSQFDLSQAFSILGNIFNLIIMLGSAALGVIMYYELPNLFIMLSRLFATRRLKSIDSRLEDLSADWGRETVYGNEK